MHVNSTVALCPPSINLDDGGTYHASPMQRWIWDNWLEFCEASKSKQNPLAILNGDLVEGDRRNRTYQIISRNANDLIGMFADVIKPLGDVPLKITKGTEAHVGKSGVLEELIARDLESEIAWEYYINVDNVLIEIAHHATMGGLPWSKPGSVARYAARTMFAYWDRAQKAPDLVIRGHCHQWGDSYDAHHTRAIMAPAWTAASAYVHRIAPGAMADIGGFWVYCDGGKYEVEKFKVIPRKRIWQKI